MNPQRMEVFNICRLPLLIHFAVGHPIGRFACANNVSASRAMSDVFDGFPCLRLYAKRDMRSILSRRCPGMTIGKVFIGDKSERMKCCSGVIVIPIEIQPVRHNAPCGL